MGQLNSLSILATVFLLFSTTSNAQDFAYLLSSNREALNARLSLIAESHDPFLSAFEIAEDHVGLALLSSLIQAAQKGGHPKLLLDALGHRLTPDLIRYLMHQNVEVRLFRASYVCSIARFGSGELTQRMHNKILTNESGLMITGGRNSRDQFFGLDPNKQNFIDFDVLVLGDSARSARSYQQQMWSSAMVQTPYDYWIPGYMQNGFQEKIESAVNELRKAGIVSATPQSFESSLKPTDVTFIHDVVTGAKAMTESAVRGAGRALLDAIDQAKSEVLIDSQYLILTPELQDSFSRAVRRGVHVEIATNGARAFSTPADGIERDAFEMYKPQLRATGVSVREYQGPGKIHSKSVVIDRSVCFIWSFNLDPRSQNINYEAGARLHSQGICTELANHMAAHMRLAPMTIRDGHAVVPDRILSSVERALIDAIQGEL